MKHFRVIGYELDNPDSLAISRDKLTGAVKALADVPDQCPYPLTPEKVIALSCSTILVNWQEGRREHYQIAQHLAASKCSRMFLMQRSSSLILGPEQDWCEESSFYEAVLKAVESGTELFHITSLEGIARHLNRPQSHFPSIKSAWSKLNDSKDCVEIVGKNIPYLVRRVPDEQDDEDLKPDRQTRTLIVEYDSGIVEGVLVNDLGGAQVSFHLRGPLMREFLEVCLRFYSNCPVLTWSELREVVHT